MQHIILDFCSMLQVFIGGLLRETFEDKLVPMLEECGMIFDLRIMTNPTDGVNKGFAFCIFTSSDAAKNCVNKVSLIGWLPLAVSV